MAAHEPADGSVRLGGTLDERTLPDTLPELPLGKVPTRLG
jgi:hypothetical protein